MKDNNKKTYYEWNDILFLIGYITLTFFGMRNLPAYNLQKRIYHTLLSVSQ